MLKLLLLPVLAFGADIGGPRDILAAAEIHNVADDLSDLAGLCEELDRELAAAAEEDLPALAERARELSAKVERVADAKKDLDLSSDAGIVERAKERLADETEDFERGLDDLRRAAKRAADRRFPRSKAADDLAQSVTDAEWTWTRP